MSRKRGVAEDKLQAIDRYADHPGYSARERAALGYAEMLTISPNEITDAQFAELRQHFNEREIVELTVQAAFEKFRAQANRPLRIEDDGFATRPVEQLPRAL
mgnify:FL=1